MVTDSQGNVIARRDFKPFGEEITDNTGERTTAAKYGPADNLRQKFTTYQRDEESGLDFAEARMYENRHGRFTAVDPLLASGKSPNPQTFNRFVYVLNNPLILSDPEGLQAGSSEESENDVVARISTWICESFWCKIKSGFNQLVKVFVPNKPGESNEQTDREERKRTGTDKVVKSAVVDYSSNVDQVTQTVNDIEPTGIGNLVDKSVKNSLNENLASDEDVRNATISAGINSLLTVFPEGKAGKVLSRIGEVPGLARAAEVAGKSVQGSLDNLVAKLAAGNLNPGLGTKKLFGNISYARARDGARVFFREVDGVIEVLAKASKENEDQVITLLKKTYGN